MSRKKQEGLKLYGVYTFTIRDAVTNKIKRVYKYKNIIPTVGRTMLANNLTDTAPDNDPRINYTALGTGITAPDNADTKLQTEVFRKLVASQTNTANVGYVTAFYTAPETSGTYKEAGVFCNATAAADSGVLFSRVAIDITKSVSESLTIDYTITIS